MSKGKLNVISQVHSTACEVLTKKNSVIGVEKSYQEICKECSKFHTANEYINKKINLKLEVGNCSQKNIKNIRRSKKKVFFLKVERIVKKSHF